MKKKIITLLFIITMLIPFIKIKAAYMDSYIDWNLDRTVFAHQYRDGSDHITNLAMITANGVPAYCIQPGVVADKASYYSSTTNIEDTNAPWANSKKLSLIGYYGYGYPGHEAKEYYMAAQELIWREMGVENVWWTDSKYGGNILDIDYYKNEIINLVNNYEVSPSFDFKSKYIVGDTVALEDKNNVLSSYEVLGNNNVTIDGNKIIIKVKDGDNSFILKRKQNGKFTKFYYKDGYQTIGSFEFPYDYEKSYNIDYIYGKIIVDKLDFDTKSKITSSKDASLQGALYGLYDENGNLIASKKTDEEGKIIFDGLVKGNYTVKELEPSLGYTKDETIYDCVLDTDSLEIIIKSYEKVIKNKVIITKVLDNEENKTCTPEEGILFYVYDDQGNYVTEGITDNNGNITLELNYGKYILKQMSAPFGIDRVKEVIISVTKDGIIKNITLVNHRIRKDVLPDTGKRLYGFLTLILLFITGALYEKKRT